MTSKRYSLDELRRMTSVELREQLTNSHDLVRVRAQIELDKRESRRPVKARVR
jgi:hypothetical protein